jgi:hypothetical protein
MHHLRLALLPLLFLVAACSGGSPLHKRVVGAWQLDAEALATQLEEKADANPNMPASARQMVGSLAEALRETRSILTFAPDQTFVGETTAMGRRSVSKGEWRIESDQLVIVQKEADGKAKEDTQRATVHADRIEFSAEKNGQRMTMVLRPLAAAAPR